jgi:3-phosphoshikimate 1-carboxyvinyltransferase
MNCLKQLGVAIEKSGGDFIVTGIGPALKRPASMLDAGNSGTTVRLLSGILAGQGFDTEIAGDASLSRRPMKRIVDPLEKMGAKIDTNNGLLPLKIHGGALQPISYDSPIASAQVKSCVLFAGLYADGVTSFTEPFVSRDHTERMLKGYGADITVKGSTVTVRGIASLSAHDITVPCDISAAAFFIVAALITENSELVIEKVGVNPTRTGIIDVLNRMGAGIRLENRSVSGGEPVADIVVKSAKLNVASISAGEIPLLIDEIPVIAVAATQAQGVTSIRGASELRFKETDRLKAVASELKKMGAKVVEFDDGLEISGPASLKGAKVESYLDHRIAMSLAVASLVAEGDTDISDKECVSISFPEFWSQLRKVSK